MEKGSNSSNDDAAASHPVLQQAVFTNRNTKDAKGFRDIPNPDSGRVKKVGGIAGRRTGASATFRYFGLLYSS